MWKVRDFQREKVKYRRYSPSAMTSAYMKIKECGGTVRGTAREFGIPEASLRHKLCGRVNPEAVRSGPAPIFSQEEEALLVNHLKFTASVGYGYSRREVVDIASEYSVSLGHREKGHQLSIGWYVHLTSRWPELKALAPRGLDIQRAKATSVECVSKYYTELGRILTKYNLSGSPERIYNVDEKGLSTTHKPPSVIAATGTKPPAVVSATRINVTVLGCGNAQGQQIPPYFVFPGLRMRKELLEGGTPGADGEVSESGWSNGDIFRTYLQSHLLKYLPSRNPSQPVLLLYDGHRSHINLALVEWAKSENIILFVLPAHTSHVLQPMDVGCFGPFERIFNSVCHKFMREHCGQSITKFDICRLSCAAYIKALSQENLQSAFRKSGIYPFNPDAVDASHFQPSKVQQQRKGYSDDQSNVTPDVIPAVDNDPLPNPVHKFFSQKEAPLIQEKPPTKKRRCLSAVVSGKAITEDSMVQAIKDHETSTKPKSKRREAPAVIAIPSGERQRTKPSAKPVPENDPASSSSTEDESEKCCVCNKFSPAEIRQSHSIIFVKWVQCDVCGHWVHLNFCTNIKVVRLGDTFRCIHCSD